jgi:GNAT superfamily N-acetyltransferase
MEKEVIFTYKGLFGLPRQFSAFISDIGQQETSDQSEARHLSFYRVGARGAISWGLVTIKARKYIHTCNLILRHIIIENNIVNSLEIADICIQPSLRNRGLGTQLLHAIEKFAKYKECKYMFGELERDDGEGSLEQRKRFFERNGFLCWHEPRGGRMSGWLIKKEIQ